jgi:hypothetical protein
MLGEHPEARLPLQCSTLVVACKDGLIESQVGDEVVFLSTQQSICYGLNRVGSRIWSLIAKPIQISDLCALLLDAYGVEPSVCKRQVLDLLEELRAEGLIEALAK